MSVGDVTASQSTSTPTATWDECVGPAKWLSEPLQRILSYPHPLPVQQAVIPTITRALMSGVPNDVSLTAPTGSGKTLCYLVPLLRLLTETKKGVDDNALRCLILVPTSSLGQQVHRELQRLTRPTSIRVACICAEGSADAHATEADIAEANQLVRRVTLPSGTASSFPSATAEPEGFTRSGDGPRSRETGSNDGDSSDSESDVDSEADGNNHNDDEEEDYGNTNGVSRGDASGTAHGGPASHVQRRNGARVRYFSNADVVVATPQRLLYHLDHTRGLRLQDLRLLVLDEADQVLVGNFASQVQKVNARYEYEVRKQQQAQQRRQQRTSAALAACMTATHAIATGGQQGSAFPSSLVRSLHGSANHNAGGGATTLHKVLCSATLSSRIARISQVKLRNCSYYVLDSNGEERKEEATVAAAAATAGVQKKDSAAAALAMTVRTQFALPPTLQEHVLFVEDSYRPAVLLKLVHTLRERIAAVRKENRAKAAQRDAEGTAGESSTTTAAHSSDEYPSVESQAGTGILVFCATAEEARVMSHFLAAAGITSVVEFTTLASEPERRRALLQRPTSGEEGEAAEVACVVASDALMRGIDIPNVGHVIMYHPPDAVSQYVHRAGRTARAMRPGHVHLLLSKTGPSGTQEDGEMALFKRLSQSLSRTLPVSYERLFFRFVENPAATTATAATTTTPVSASDAKMAPAVGSAEWWVAQAELFLIQSQHQLQRRWASVLESAAAIAAANAKKTAIAVAGSAAIGGGAGVNGGQKRPAAAASSSASASKHAAPPARKKTRSDGARVTATD